jgi:Uma2 family endonuclease
LLADVIKALLDHEGREYDSFTPVTMELPEESGIEPDYCFYVDNWQAISGKQRINWQEDPPPDLVIEVDVTSYTDVADYLPYRVPEVWLWKKQVLKIYWLQSGEYVLHDRSMILPLIDLTILLQTVFEDAYARNSSFAIRNLRKRLLEY